MTNYHHLSTEERAIIHLEQARGSSLRQIAVLLNRSPSTISREISRNTRQGVTYCSTHASQAYRQRRAFSRKPRRLYIYSPLRQIVEFQLSELKWSPEQIAATLKKQFPNRPEMQVSHETIYAHIYAYPR